jgi:hypothetical protein
VPAAEPRPPRPIWRRIPVGWLVVGALVVTAAFGGWFLNAGRSSSGAIDKPGDLQASDLRVGDCFDLKDASADEIEDVRAVPCSQAHEFELFYDGTMPDGEYPTEAAFESFVGAACGSAFEAYVGTTFDDSALDAYWLVPTDDSWRSGDRQVQCAAYDPENPRSTGSVKGTRQ